MIVCDATAGYEQCFWFLLEEGADINSVDNALHAALHIGTAPAYAFGNFVGDPKTVNFSIIQRRTGATLSSCRAWSNEALISMAQIIKVSRPCSHTVATAHCSRRDEWTAGKRPLHKATMSGSSDCVDFLLAKRASPNSPSTNGFLVRITLCVSIYLIITIYLIIYLLLFLLLLS
jgi:hypothetical protein